MRILSFLSLFAACVLQLGCAAQKVSLTTHKRIGVVSLVPNKLETKYVGIWAFSNKGAEADVPDANFTRNTRVVTEGILRSAGFEVVSIPQDFPNLISQYLKRKGSLGSYFADNFVGDCERKTVGADLKTLAQKYNLNAIALITPRPPTGGGEANVGVGRFGFGTLSSDKDRVSAYSMTRTLFLDATTLKTMTFRFGHSMEPVEIPFKADFREYSPEQRQTLLSTMNAGFGESAKTMGSRIAKP